jgi:ABC-type polysaccharide/polyol phosphate export permease
MAAPPESGSAVAEDAVAADAETIQAAGAEPRAQRASSLRRRADVVLALTESDLRARYGRGPLRMVKWLLDPFAVCGVYLLLVTYVLDRGGPAPGLSIACAVVPFQLLMNSVVGALSAVGLRRSIILNMSFERAVIPVSTVMTESVAFAASLLLLVMMMALYSIAPTVALLWLPLVILVTIILAVACAYPLSLLGLWFRELRVFFVSFMRTMFYLAPGLIALAEIEGRPYDLVKLNPLTGVFESFRDVLLYGQRPAAWQLLFPLAFAVVLLLVFVPIYRLEQRDFAKVVE